MSHDPTTRDHPRSGTLAALLVLLLVGLFAPSSAAQTDEELLRLLLGLLTNPEFTYGPELRAPRDSDLLVKSDETGLWEWREFEREDCDIGIEKEGKRIHPRECRHCGGSKKKLRLSDETPCMVCPDGKIHCHVCNGIGKIAVGSNMSSGTSLETCLGCGGAGKFKCTTCKGRRVVKFDRLGGKLIREAKQEDLKSRYDRLAEIKGELYDLIRSEGERASFKARKYRSELAYVPGHIALMSKLQKREGGMKAFRGGDGFAVEVGRNFSKSLDAQIDAERRIIAIALKRHERNALLTPTEPDEKKDD